MEDAITVERNSARELELEGRSVGILHSAKSTQVIVPLAEDRAVPAAGIAILGLLVLYERTIMQAPGQVLNGAFGPGSRGLYTFTIEVLLLDEEATHERAFAELNELGPDAEVEQRPECIVERREHEGILHQRIYVAVDHVCFALHMAALEPDELDVQNFVALGQNIRPFLCTKDGQQVDLWSAPDENEA